MIAIAERNQGWNSEAEERRRRARSAKRAIADREVGNAARVVVKIRVDAGLLSATIFLHNLAVRGLLFQTERYSKEWSVDLSNSSFV